MEKFTCEMCGGEFDKGSDEAAEAEAKELFGVEHAATDPDMAIVCDGCFKRFMSSDIALLAATEKRGL